MLRRSSHGDQRSFRRQSKHAPRPDKPDVKSAIRPTHIGLSCISVCHSSTSARDLAVRVARNLSGPSSIKRRCAARNSYKPNPPEHAKATIKVPPGSQIPIGVTIPLIV